MRTVVVAVLAAALVACDSGEADDGTGGVGGGGERDVGIILDLGMINIDAGMDGPDILLECMDGETRPCGMDVGACQMGVYVCRGGLFGAECEGEVAPADELCNMLDDDCDGFADEGYNLGRSCKALNDRNVEVDGETACDPETGGVVCIPLESCEVDNDSDGVTACTDCDDDDPDNTPGGPERCDGRDNDCDQQVDEIFADLEDLCYVGQGNCRVAGTVVCAADGLGTICDAEEGAAAPIERCGDQEDNDCDGLVDEGFNLGEACRVGNGACEVDGVLVCDAERTGTVCMGDVPPPESPEQCGTGVDEDCDGETDEGFAVGEICAEGIGGCRQQGRQVCNEAGNGVVCNAEPLQPREELCGDAIDNDCDGELDELVGLGDPCGVGVGLCRREGELVCGENGAVVCSAAGGEPQDELCDGRDQDCDGRIDETFDLNGVCFAGEGECRNEGITICRDDGLAIECNAEPLPVGVERCDTRDNDCDGRIDEGYDVGAPCEGGFGLCLADGRIVCGPDGRATCDAEPLPPEPEVCDRIDNDCDGGVDEIDIYLFDDPLNCGRCGNVCPGEHAICADANCFRVYYVDPTGSDANDGGPETPWRTLTHAVSNAEGPLVLIRVNPGTYGVGVSEVPEENETFPIVLRDGIQIIGQGEGFDRAAGVQIEGDGSDFFVLANANTLPNKLEAMAFTGGRSVVRLTRSDMTLFDVKVSDTNATASVLVDAREASTVVVEQARVLRSTSRSGCSVWIADSDLTVDRTLFEGNGNDASDADICLQANSVGRVTNTVFAGNDGRGITARFQAAPMVVVHSTFADLTAPGITLTASTAYVANSLFTWTGSAGVDQDAAMAPADVELRNNLFFGHTRSAWTRSGQVLDLEAHETSVGNLVADPQIFSRIQLIFRLREASPAIDAADGAITDEFRLEFDHDGSLRDEAPDIGAYEFR